MPLSKHLTFGITKDLIIMFGLVNFSNTPVKRTFQNEKTLRWGGDFLFFYDFLYCELLFI